MNSVDSPDSVEFVGGGGKCKKFCIQTSYLLCKKPALCLSATKTQVTEKILN